MPDPSDPPDPVSRTTLRIPLPPEEWLGPVYPSPHPQPLPSPLRTGDRITRLNFRPGILFSHFDHSGEVTLGTTYRVIHDQPGRDPYSGFAWGENATLTLISDTEGRQWSLGSHPLIAHVLGTTCGPSASGHYLTARVHRATALALRNAGMPWATIARFTGFEFTGFECGPAADDSCERDYDNEYSGSDYNDYDDDDDDDLAADYDADPGIPTRHPGRPARFGIEIEFEAEFDAESDCGCGDCSGEDTRDYLHEHIVTLAATAEYPIRAQTESYGHATRAYWKLVTDASVSGGEFVSPPLPLNEAGLDQVRTALHAVRNGGGLPGRGQGMHVHHEIADFGPTAMCHLLSVLRAWQGAIMAAVPSGRWTSSGFCNLLSGDDWYQLRLMASAGNLRRLGLHARRNGHCPVDPYTAFNFDATLAYGTLEFRGLGDTLNTQKVTAWIQVTGAVIEYARRNLPIPEITDGGIETATMLAVLREHELIEEETALQVAAMAPQARRATVLDRIMRIDPFAATAA